METFKIQLGDGNGDMVEFTCRKPTHQEFDAREAWMCIIQVIRYQGRIVAEEEAATEGASGRIRRLLRLTNQFLDDIDDIFMAAMRAITQGWSREESVNLDEFFGPPGDARQVASFDNVQALLGALKMGTPDVEGFPETSGPEQPGGIRITSAGSTSETPRTGA